MGGATETTISRSPEDYFPKLNAQSFPAPQARSNIDSWGNAGGQVLFLVRKPFTPVLLGFLVLRSETLNPFESTWNEELILRKAVILSIIISRP